MSSKEYKCNICNKIYASYKSLWYHNYKYHKNTTTNKVIESKDISKESKEISKESKDIIKQFKCKYCDKIYKHKQTKWFHEKSCSNNIHINQLNNTTNNINNTNNNTTTNNIINNNKIIINKIGNENVFDLTITEVMDIFNKEISCITLLIEYLHFNERLPENHSFCTTNLESKYISVYNTDKQLIEKDRKKYLFDTILDNSTNKLELLFTHYKNKFSHARQYNIKETINNIKQLKISFYDEKLKKEICNKINLLSYNNKIIIQNTWNGKNIKKKKHLTFQEDLELPPSDSDNHISNSESESDLESSDIPKQLNLKSKII